MLMRSVMSPMAPVPSSLITADIALTSYPINSWSVSDLPLARDLF